MTDSAAPGWYHAQGDPPGTERYWDGSAWTEGPRPVAPATPETPSGFGTETPGGFSTETPSGFGTETLGGFSTETPSGFGTETPGGFSTETPSGFGTETPGGFSTETPSGFGTQTPGGFAAPATPAAGGFPGAPAGIGASYYPEESQAQTALILAIVGALVCGPLAIVGAVMGNKEKNAIDAGRRDPANRGKAMAALIIGGIIGVLTVLAILFIVLALVLGAASG